MDRDGLERLAQDAGSELEAEDLRRLLAYVRELGASDDEIAAAIGEMNIGGLALDLALRRGGTRPFEQVAAAAGMDLVQAARFWRSMGFPDPVTAGTHLSDDAAAALQLFGLSEELFGEDATVALGRVVGTAASRVAQAILDAYRVQFETPHASAGAAYSAIVRNYTDLAREVLPRFIDAFGAVLVRHLVATGSSQWSPDAEGAAAQQDLVVGFADLTGYTALSRTLSPRELTGLIAAFEDAVSEAASAHGGRIVKLVGDGAMFSADDVDRGCAIGIAIAERSAQSDVLPSVRVGLAAGHVVNLGGDLFGDVVNLAARLVAVAPEGSVILDEVARARSSGGWTFDPLPAQELKGIGAPAVAYRVTAAGPDPRSVKNRQR